MPKNPFFNALLASGYISLVASVVYYGPKQMGPIDAVIVPVAILSLFVLSAVIMGFSFFINPYKCILKARKRRR